MTKCALRGRILPLVFALAITAFAPHALSAPGSRAQALADLEHAQTERRAEAVVWIAKHGARDDEPLLFQRLHDESPFVRGFAEQGLWLLWGRSGDPAIDQLMARGVSEMQAGEFGKAGATFSEVIRRRPDFAEGWNKRATVRYLAGELRASLADCDEVIRRNPRHFGALSGYGQIHFQLGDYARAIEYWRRALAVNPNMTGVEMNIRGAEEMLRQKRGKTA